MQGKLAQEAWTTEQGGDRGGVGDLKDEVQTDGAYAQEEGLSWNYPASRWRNRKSYLGFSSSWRLAHKDTGASPLETQV